MKEQLGIDNAGPPGGVEYCDVVPSVSESRWRSIVHVLRSPFDLAGTIAGDLITTFFPADCRVCSEPLLEATGPPVCRECINSLGRRTTTACWRCGDWINAGLDMEDLRFRGLECLACRLVPPEFARAAAFGTYQDELRELVHLLKYGGLPGIAKLLGDRLAQAILDLEDDAAGELLVVAVPLFAPSERRRGYNQARLLADAAIKRLGTIRPQWKLQAAHQVLQRRKSTASQYELSRKARRRNLAGAFVCSGDVTGREILLIDDILTTGATARECARVLKRAGAAKVWVATVARACGADEVMFEERPEAYVARWDRPTN